MSFRVRTFSKNGIEHLGGRQLAAPELLHPVVIAHETMQDRRDVPVDDLLRFEAMAHVLRCQAETLHEPHPLIKRSVHFTETGPQLTSLNPCSLQSSAMIEWWKSLCSNCIVPSFGSAMDAIAALGSISVHWANLTARIVRSSSCSLVAPDPPTAPHANKRWSHLHPGKWTIEIEEDGKLHRIPVVVETGKTAKVVLPATPVPSGGKTRE